MVKNKFNNLTSKEWLPFQKSWFRYTNKENLFRENIRFFTKSEENYQPVIFYYGKDEKMFHQVAMDNNCKITKQSANENIDFVVIDLLDRITYNTTTENFQNFKKDVLELLKSVYERIIDRKFVWIISKNIETVDSYYPFSWDIAKNISYALSLKDEKIGCMEAISHSKIKTLPDSSVFHTQQNIFYSLYFRKDENNGCDFSLKESNLFKNITQPSLSRIFIKNPSNWFILKPQPRKKDEILHPAKYPEDLVDMFLSFFTDEYQVVFDPMSGTGSTQVAALKNNRHAYGTELSDFFCEIANNRCKRLFDGNNNDYHINHNLKYEIKNIDARDASLSAFPKADYLLTSPPYWDMLNMKGAENQAKRLKMGLQLNYSNSDEDLGNISDYELFINELVEIYEKLISLMKPSGYITIIVKNIKKKGRNYPFAWDLAEKLQNKLTLLPELFWCQDDLSIAPYGYGNTWVSNTFHHYCLNFKINE